MKRQEEPIGGGILLGTIGGPSIIEVIAYRSGGILLRAIGGANRWRNLVEGHGGPFGGPSIIEVIACGILFDLLGAV